MKKVVNALFMSAMVSACTVRSAVPTTVTASDADFLAWTGKGVASINGQAFLLTNGGDVKTCAGNAVYLIPANNYTQSIYLQNEAADRWVTYGNYYFFDKFTRVSTCGARGHFHFKNVPTGKWFIQASVFWLVPEEYTSLQQGGRLIREIDLHQGYQRTILTRRNIVDWFWNDQ